MPSQALDHMSAVSRAEFERWSRAEQLAFLINAYNAFTVELVLGAWPRLMLGSRSSSRTRCAASINAAR